MAIQPPQRFQLDDLTHVEREARTIYAPGATPGDVLVVQSDHSLVAAPGGGSMPGVAYQVIRTIPLSDFATATGLSTVFYELQADEVFIAGGLRVTEAFDDSGTPTFNFIADATNSVNLLFATSGAGPGVTAASAGLIELPGTGAGIVAQNAPTGDFMLAPSPVGLIVQASPFNGDGATGALEVRLLLAKGSAS